MSQFDEMKKAIENDEIEGQFSYDDEFADYVSDIYAKAIEAAEKTVQDTIEIEPSVQAGMGSVFMYCGKAGTTNWDFEDECDVLLDFATDTETEEEFKESIKNFILNKYNDCISDDDPDDYEDDEDSDFEDYDDDFGD